MERLVMLRLHFCLGILSISRHRLAISRNSIVSGTRLQKRKYLFVGTTGSDRDPEYTSNMPLLQVAFVSTVEINYFSQGCWDQESFEYLAVRPGVKI
jgi:hypothetical protein